MLNITAQSNAEGAKSYFAKSDYYASVDDQEIVGEWGGKGAVLLGLFGKVDKPSFDRLCDNLHWRTGDQITRITRDNRRVGFDFTWSAPKSVSVVHALTGDDGIMQAFRNSIADTMHEMEADMQARVRRGGVESDRTTGNLVWAEFVHLTSRPVNGLPAPQLHCHLFASNATYDAVEQQWKAGQFGKIKQDAYYWQAVQQARFAVKLRELGYGVHKTKDAFEITGIPDAVLKKYSLRTGVIERAAEKLGITNAKSKAKLAATTREAKDDSVPYSQLVERWESMLSPDEAAAIATVAHDKSPKHVALHNAQHARFAVEHLFERASVADERRLLTVALRHGCGEVTPEGVRAETDRHALLKREEAGKIWVTTREALRDEASMITFAVKGKGSCKPMASKGTIQLKESRLNDGQRQAVEHLLTSADRVMLVRGGAGTGKTTLTREAVSQIEERGKSVVMLAPSAQASRGVLRDEGFSGADTLSKFLVDEKMQAGAADGFIFLDEAGLVGTQSLKQLFDVAKNLNARVILAGDTRQSAPIERGAPLHVLESIARLPVAEVTEIQRQKPADYKQAVGLLAKGHVIEGFDKLDAMGCVKVTPVFDSYAPLAKDYIATVSSGQSALIVSPSHAEADLITTAVRQQLVRDGKLSVDEHEFVRLVPLHWTAAERADPKQYSGDEMVQFHHNAGTFKAGQRLRASDALPGLAAVNSKHYSVYQAETIRVAKGESIRLTGNGKTVDGKHKLNNGAIYEIAGFTRDGDIQLTNGWTVAHDFGQFAYGYVSTAQAAQGRTVDRVLLAQSTLSYPATGPENFYVSASRGRHSIVVYTDDKFGLKEAIRRSRPRLSATELASKPKPQLWRRMRNAVAKFQQAALVAAKRAAHDLGQAVTPREPIYER